jgi:hypothetical protein
MKGDWDSAKEKSEDLSEDFPHDVMGMKIAIFLELAQVGN